MSKSTIAHKRKLNAIQMVWPHRKNSKTPNSPCTKYFNVTSSRGNGKGETNKGINEAVRKDMLECRLWNHRNMVVIGLSEKVV